jgi:hypothetical protein
MPCTNSIEVTVDIENGSCVRKQDKIAALEVAD